MALLGAALLLATSCGDDDDGKGGGGVGPGSLPAGPEIANTANESSITTRASEQTVFATEYSASLQGVPTGSGSNLRGVESDPALSLANPLTNLQAMANLSPTASPELPRGFDDLAEDPSSDSRCQRSLQVLGSFTDFAQALTTAASLGQIEAQNAEVKQVEFTKNQKSASEALNYTIKTTSEFGAESGSSFEMNVTAGSDDTTFFLRQSSTFNIDLSKFFEDLKKAFDEAGSDSSAGEGLSGISVTTTGSTGLQLAAKPEEKLLTVYQQASGTLTVSARGQSFSGTSSSLRTLELDGTEGFITVSNTGNYNFNGTSVTANHKLTKVSDSAHLFELSWNLNKAGTAKDVSTKLTVTRAEDGNCSAAFEGAVNPDDIESFVAAQ